MLHSLCTDIPAPGHECVCIHLRNEKYLALLSWGFEIHHDLPSEEANCSVIESHMARQSVMSFFFPLVTTWGRHSETYFEGIMWDFFSDSLNRAEM